MKRNRLYLKGLFTLLIAVSIIIGCKKDLLHIGTNASEDVLANHHVNLQQLQSIYNAGTGNKLKTNAVSQQTIASIIGSLNVDWTTYTLYENADSTQIVEFDMPDDKNFVLPDALPGGDSSKFRSKTAAVFILRKDTVKLSFLMKTVEDGTAAGYQPVLNQSHYQHIPATFTGNVFYFNLNKEFINGYAWDKGNVSKTLTINSAPMQQHTQSTGKPVIKPNLSDCFTLTYDVYYIRIFSDGSIAWDTYLYSFDVSICFGGGGNGGGGGAPAPGSGGVNGDPTVPKPCIVVNPPVGASVKGKIIINTQQYNPGDGGGGAPPNPPPPCPPVTPQDIIDNLSNPCLKAALDKLKNNSFSGEVSDIVKLFNVSDHINVSFNEAALNAGVYGDTRITYDSRSYYESSIRLNTNVLNGSSQELIASTMIHELFHSYFDYNNTYYADGLGQHLEIATQFVDKFRNYLQKSFPGLSTDNANGLIINGFSEIQQNLPNNFQQILDHYNLTIQDVVRIREQYKQNGTSGLRCN